MNGLVLVTGGTGKTGASLAAQLDAAGVGHRIASRHTDVPFDWERPDTWDGALRDVEAVYLVAPTTVHEPYPLMIDFAAAAQRRGVRRFVLLSMASLAAGGPAHGQVHQWLVDHTDDWAVLCPTAFMQNFSHGPYLASIRDEDRIYSNTGSGRLPFIDVTDIAAAALTVLTAPDPARTEHLITGDESMDYDHVADIVSDACHRRITHVHVSSETMVQRYLDRGLPEGTARLLAFSYERIAAGDADRTTDVLRPLIGRPPTTFEAFAAANAHVWAPTTPTQ